MTIYYEVREDQKPGSRPEERGAIIKLCETFAEAMAEAARLNAQGRNVSVNRSEGWA